jgi:hypothetical protein
LTNHMNRWRKNRPERNILAANHHLEILFSSEEAVIRSPK